MEFPAGRKDLCADGLVRLVRDEFRDVPDSRCEPQIRLVDALLGGLAVFSLKCSSLLAFDQERRHNAFNLSAMFGMKDIPCDTQMRDILDDVDPVCLRPAFTSVFRALQRGKVLEPFVFWEGHYLLASDGTTYFSSEQVHCDACLQKRSRNGVVTYYHQLLGWAIVHPDHREVIPLCPEPIVKQDGTKKNDGERSATARALEHFRREHPRLPVIMVEDALSGNAPHLADLQRHNVRFILGVKPGSHAHLFEQMALAVQQQRVEMLTLQDKGTLHHFRWLKDAALNKSHADQRVTMVEYWEISLKEQQCHFSWITDLTVTHENVELFARGGRARWKIENETFNTLKNQGYHFEHNFGHGKKYLSTIFATLMMLAFLLDQVQQLCDEVFQALLKKMGTKRRLWSRIRGVFECFRLSSFRQMHELLLNFQHVDPTQNTS